MGVFTSPAADICTEDGCQRLLAPALDVDCVDGLVHPCMADHLDIDDTSSFTFGLDEAIATVTGVPRVLSQSGIGDEDDVSVFFLSCGTVVRILLFVMLFLGCVRLFCSGITDISVGLDLIVFCRIK